MKRSLGLFLLALALSTLTSVAAFAQANNGSGTQRLGVSFYKVPPGRQDEWLALYKKVHKRIIQWEIDHGQIVSSTVYHRAGHQLSPAWDFAIVTIGPSPDKRKKPELTRTQLIHKLFPNLDEYVKDERARWALTLEHWDESWVDIDLDKNPSLYYPDPL